MKNFEEKELNEKSGEKKLMFQFFRVMQLAHRIKHENNPFHGGYRGQGRVLSLLKMKPETTQKELAYILDIRNQSLGELLTKLESAGHIERIPSADDKRMMTIRLTEAGKEAAEQAETREKKANKIFEILNIEEQDQLYALLEKLITGLEGQTADKGDCNFEPHGFKHFWHGRPNKERFHSHHCHKHEEKEEDKDN